MQRVLVISEKPDMSFKYAAALGGVILDDNTELTTKDLTKRESYIKNQSKAKGYFKGVAKRSDLKGAEITYAWARGHLVNLYNAKDYDDKYSKWTLENFPFIPQHFNNKVLENPYAHSQFNLLKKLLHEEYDLVINGADAEREGELIYYRIYELANSKLPVKRLWLNSTKEEDIIKEFSNLQTPNPYLLEAAKARAYADWLYGINYTVLYSLKTNVKTPIGRIKLPTLKLIVDRYNEVTNFKSEKYYQLNAYVKKENQIVKFTLEDKYTDKFKIEELLKSLKADVGTIINIENKEEKELAPAFYSLSKLQSDANNLYGYTLSKTLDITQKLYDNSYVTYPRTDSTVIPVSEEINMKNRINYIPEYFNKFKEIAIQNINNGMKLGIKYVKDTSSAHFGIVVNNKADNLAEDEKNIYDLICRSVISPFLGPALWNNEIITLRLNDINFIAKGKSLKVEGFRALIPNKKGDTILPHFNKDENIKIEKIEIEEKETKPKQLYTDSTLVTAMANIKNHVEDKEYKEILAECKGIGTEATRSALLESLIEAKYIERKKKNLIPTPLGINVIEKFPIEDIKSPITTAKWEMRLNNIVDGKEHLNNMLEDIKENIIRNSDIIKNMQTVNWGTSSNEIIGKCPSCGGNIIEGKKGYGCSNWKEKECKFVIWNTIAHKKISKTQVKKLLEVGKSDYIEGFKSSKGNSFSAFLILTEDNQIKFEFKNDTDTSSNEIIGKCPSCGGNIIEGKKGYGCSNWKEKECKFVIWNTIAHKKISKTQVKKLLEVGKSDYIEGFKSSKGNSFGAFLILTEDNQIKFEFENSSKEKEKKIGQCPMCNGDILESNQYYYCSDCDLKIYKKIAEYTLKDKDIKELLKYKRTNKIDGFLSKKKKTFSASLVIDKNKVIFEFY